MSGTLTPSRLTEHRGMKDRPALVFLHGVYHGSWAFRTFCEPFRVAGFPVAMVDLRGHSGESRITKKTNLGFYDYLKDVRHALDSVEGEKIVVGHSLGGLLTLALEPRSDVIGCVLVSTPLPSVLRSKSLRLLCEFPLRCLRFILLRQAWALYHHGTFIDRYLLSEHTPDATRATALAEIKSQHEPHRVFRDVMSLKLSATEPRPPTLILRGEEDPSATPTATRRLRRLTAGDVVTIPHAGHDIMLDPGAPVAADAIMRWLPKVRQSDLSSLPRPASDGGAAE